MGETDAMLKKHFWIFGFNLAYILPFTWFYLRQGNFEFLWYVLVLVFFFALIFATLSRTRFDGAVLWGLSVWGFLHMAGGGLQVGPDVLYALVLVPLVSQGEFQVLRFDQCVHFFGFAVSTLVGYQLLRPRVNAEAGPKMLAFIAAVFGMGLGALNEVVEFLAVLMLPETGVGGYINTGMDLIANMLGSLTAAAWIYIQEKCKAKAEAPAVLQENSIA